MAGTGRSRWMVGGLAVAGLLVVGLVVQAGLAIAELWDGLVGDASTAVEDTRAKAPSAGRLPGVPPAADGESPFVANPGQVAGRSLPIVARPATLRPSLGVAHDPDTDELHHLALRRAARERWRASQSPEELEARRQRQEARRAARTGDQIEIRDQQRDWKRKTIDGADPEEEPPLEDEP